MDTNSQADGKKSWVVQVKLRKQSIIKDSLYKMDFNYVQKQ